MTDNAYLGKNPNISSKISIALREINQIFHLPLLFMRIFLTDSTSSISLLSLPFLFLQLLNAISLSPFPRFVFFVKLFFPHSNVCQWLTTSTVLSEPQRLWWQWKFTVLRSVASKMAELFTVKRIGLVSVI